MVLRALTSLGGGGVQGCRNAWEGRAATEQGGGASGRRRSLVAP